MLFSMYFVHTAPSDALQLGRSVQTLEDDWKQTYRRVAFLVMNVLNPAEFRWMK